MIRWGIIGAGNIAHRFAAGLAYEQDSVLYAISGRNEEKLKKFAQEYPCEKLYVGHENLLADPEVDAVYIALPHGLHEEWSVKALDAGKAVICEKPAVMNEAQMRNIADAAERNQVLFMEAMKSRFTPAYLELKKRLAEGVIGEIVKVRTSIGFPMPPETFGKSYHSDPVQGGSLLDSGIYCASVIEDLLGSDAVLQRIHANLRPGPIDWYVNAEMEIGGKQAVLESAFDRNIPKEAEITGTEGTILVENLHRPAAFRIRKGDQEERVEVPYDHDDFYSQIHHFAELFKAGKKESDIMPLKASLGCAHLTDVIRAGYLSYTEEDLRILEEQEKVYSFEKFGAAEALQLGNAIAEAVGNYDREVSVQIVREKDELTLFQYIMDSKAQRNMQYMAMKRQCVLDSGHSSAWCYAADRLDGRYQNWYTDGKHALSGGAFPVYAGGELTATVMVSGLHEGKDHDLILDGFRKVKGTDAPVFRKVLG